MNGPPCDGVCRITPLASVWRRCNTWCVADVSAISCCITVGIPLSFPVGWCGWTAWGALRPGHRQYTRSRGKQPQQIPPRAMVRDLGVQQCVPGHIPRRCWKVENGAGYRQAGRRRSLIGKDLLYRVRGREVTADAARADGQHPLPISPSLDWFALYSLCKEE